MSVLGRFASGLLCRLLCRCALLGVLDRDRLLRLGGWRKTLLSLIGLEVVTVIGLSREPD